ncbi:hypothetical protein MASR1M60_29070 [Rhodocyclaceae bacterium]
MQIASVNPGIAANLTGIATGLEVNSPPADVAQAPIKESPAAAQPARKPAPVENERSDSANVSISANAQTQAAKGFPAAVYAEIWQGDIKVAQVDIHGHVTSYSAMLASGGGGLAGPLAAAQRAVQVAQMLGGEIRSAGQSLDKQTLLMRAKLASAYSV